MQYIFLFIVACIFMPFLLPLSILFLGGCFIYNKFSDVSSDDSYNYTDNQLNSNDSYIYNSPLNRNSLLDEDRETNKEKLSTFNDDFKSTDIITTKITGVTFDNRQSYVKKLKVGDKVKLIKEPDNKYDKNAIAVYNLSNNQLGYIPRQLVERVSMIMNLNESLNTVVKYTAGGNGLNYGATIEISPNTKPHNKTNSNCNPKTNDNPYSNYSINPYNLESVIAQVVEVARLNGNLINPKLFNIAITEILNKKFERANGDEKLYIESLKRNILYYLNMLEDTEKLLKEWLDCKNIPINQTYYDNFDLLQKKNMCKNIKEMRNEHITLAYDDITPLDKKINTLERDYRYYNAYFDIWVDCLGVIVHNPNISTILFENTPQVIIDKLIKYCEHAVTSSASNINPYIKNNNDY